MGKLSSWKTASGNNIWTTGCTWLRNISMWSLAVIWPFRVIIGPVAYPGIFFWGGGGVQQIPLRAERMGSGGSSPKSGVPLYLQMSKTLILFRLLCCIFHRTGNLAQLCQNFWISGVPNAPNPAPLGTPLYRTSRIPRYCCTNYHRSTSMFHSWNQAFRITDFLSVLQM
jgi:hypothetical protein